MQKRLKLAPDLSNCKDVALEASKIVRDGGVLLYPTETVYGLGCDATNLTALNRVYEIKGRDSSKFPILLAQDASQVEQFVHFNESSRSFAQTWPASVTIIFEKTAKAEGLSFPHVKEVSFRVSPHQFCNELTKQAGNPVVATSANLSGASTGRSIDEILEQLGEKAALVDVIIDAGELPLSEPSTIVDCTRDTPIILREGAISKEEIIAILNS